MKPVLRIETLTELTAEDLAAVVGGEPTQLGPPTMFDCDTVTEGTPTLPVWWCVTHAR